MPSPLSFSFTTIGATDSKWSFETEDFPSSIWSFGTRNADSIWSFETESNNSVWSFKTRNNDSVWSFETSSVSSSVWSFTTKNSDSVWSFSTVDVSNNFTTHGSVSYYFVDSENNKINISFEAVDATSINTIIITNLRTGKVTTTSEFTNDTLNNRQNTPEVNDLTYINHVNIEHTIDKDGIYKVQDSSGTKVLGYLLVNPSNCLYEYAHKHINDNCKDCNEINRLRAITNIIQVSFDKRDFKLAHKMMDVLDDVCEECKIC